MKKIKAFLLACVLSIVTVVLIVMGIKIHNQQFTTDENNTVRYNFNYAKFKNRELLEKNIDKDTLVVLGSSELSVGSNEQYHYTSLFNYRDFHIMPIGGGNFQNIIQAFTLGSIGDSIVNKKLVISESFGWFDQYGIDPKAFISRISTEHMYYALKNENLKLETRTKLINRAIELAKDNTVMKERFERFKRVLIDGEGNFWDEFLVKIDVEKSDLITETKFSIHSKVKLIPYAGDVTPNYNWDELLKNAEADAKERTNNNEFGIENETFNNDIKKRMEKRKGKDYFYKYSDSPEYGDLELLLEIAKELGLEVRVINFPINGKWNDYIGIDAEQRKIYREKLTNIVQSYGYTIFDLGDKEYEPYYMYDTVHPGWKAWIEASRDLYQFFKQNNSK